MRFRSHSGTSGARIAAGLSLLVVGAMALTACTSSSGGATAATTTGTTTGAAPATTSAAPPDTASASPAATTAATQSKPVTLVVPTSQAPWNPAYAKMIEEYQKETGNTVDLRPFPSPDVKTQEINDVQSQQHTFDVYQINESDITQFNASGWLEPFANVDPSYTPDPGIDNFSNIAKWNAKQGVSNADGVITSAPLAGNVDLFMYRKDIYSQLGLSVPTTWDQVISNGQAIKDAKAAKYAGVYRTQGTPGALTIGFEFQALMNSAGAKWFKDQGTDWTPTADSPQAIQAATWLRQLAAQGPDATTTIGQAQAIAAMQAGDAAQTYIIASAGAQLEDPNNSAVGGKIGYAVLPKAADGSSSAATGLWVLAIPKGLDPDRQKAALSYIEWMTSQKAQTIFAQNGGIPIRSDYDTTGMSQATLDILGAVKDTVANLPDVPTTTRYTFAGDMLNFTENVEQAIAAGTTAPDAGMKSIQDQLTALIKSKDLPMAG
jgi:multiple sugar transport system substrate-binding protein